MTFPNVFNAAPGTKLNFLSFDHTTGRLVIEGTATVSADGQSVTTDPDNGITKPGWHGLTPPGDCVGSGGPPPKLPKPPTPMDTRTENDPVAFSLIGGEIGVISGTPNPFSTFKWKAPDALPNTPPPPPPPADCAVPAASARSGPEAAVFDGDHRCRRALGGLHARDGRSRLDQPEFHPRRREWTRRNSCRQRAKVTTRFLGRTASAC
jgi:hypothetical protein